MNTAKPAEFVSLYTQTLETARALHTQAEEVYRMAKDLEELTKHACI